MSAGSWFVVVITVLQVAAGVFYARDSKWYDAFIWWSFAIANTALTLKTELGG